MLKAGLMLLKSTSQKKGLNISIQLSSLSLSLTPRIYWYAKHAIIINSANNLNFLDSYCFKFCAQNETLFTFVLWTISNSRQLSPRTVVSDI